MSIVVIVSAFLLLNVFLFNTIGGQLLYSTSLQSSGTIQTIGVAAYRDSSCSSVMSSVDWGALQPGQSVSKVVYLRNEGNSELTLNLNTENWNPSAATTYMTLSWNYADQTLVPDQVLQVTLTLSVSQNINGIENFYFDIIIIGTS